MFFPKKHVREKYTYLLVFSGARKLRLSRFSVEGILIARKFEIPPNPLETIGKPQDCTMHVQEKHTPNRSKIHNTPKSTRQLWKTIEMHDAGTGKVYAARRFHNG